MTSKSKSGDVPEHQTEVLGDANQRHTFLLLKEAEKVSNTGAWSWNIASDEWFFSDQWHEIHGTPKRKLSKEELMPIAHLDDREAIDQAFEAMLTQNKPYDIEHRVIRQDTGEVRYVRSLGRVHFDEAGVAEQVLGAAQDITHETRTKQLLMKSHADLERSNQELLQFSYRTSHDLKAPLTTIRSLARFALEDLESGNLDEVRKNVQVILNQSESLGNLVLDILEAAKIDLEEQPPELIDFAAMVDEIVTGHSFLSSHSGVIVRQRVVQRHEHRYPRSRLFQILGNLVSNSVKFCDMNKSDRFVDVDISDQTGDLIMSVTDNGLGIPGERAGDVYEMFKKFHTKELSGSGIGMYIVKKHVDALGGEIEFSTSPEGTFFQVTIKKKGSG